jgi:predicted transcriptional regulator
MQVNLKPELEKKLNELAAMQGRSADELAQDAIAGMVDELAETREMLDRRYDDIKSGKAKLIPGEEAFARLHGRIEARRNNSPA